MLIVEKFEQILIDFFSLYHPRQVKKVPELVKEFKGQEVEVLKLLCDKYKRDYSVVPGLVDALAPAAPAAAPVIEETVEEPVAELEEVNDEETSVEEPESNEEEEEETSEEEVLEEKKED